jgi:hypothetical protein
MPRKTFFAAETSDTITGVFAGLMGPDSPFIAHARKIEEMRINGVRLGALPAQLQRDSEPRVSELYHSYSMAADMLVSLGYNAATAEIERRPEDDPPDLDIILLSNPPRKVPGEFSRVCDSVDEGIVSLTFAVDARLKKIAQSDARINAELTLASPHIAFHARPRVPLKASAVVAEICDFILGSPISDKSHPIAVPFPVSCKSLHSLAASYYWSNHGWIGGNFVRYNVPQLDLSSLCVAVKERITAKRHWARSFKSLWLFLMISESWRNVAGLFLDGVEGGRIQLNVDGYEKIIVGITGRAIALEP